MMMQTGQTADSLRTLADSITVALRGTSSQLADSIRGSLRDNYIDVLEKTNAQLSSGWSSPFGASVSWLTAVITIGGGVLAYGLWRQGRDYQVKLDTALEGFKGKMSDQVALAEATNAKLTEIAESSNAQIRESLSEIDRMIDTAEGDMKQRLEVLRHGLQGQETSARARLDDVAANKFRRVFGDPGRPFAIARHDRGSMYGGPIQKTRWECPICHTQNEGADLRTEPGFEVQQRTLSCRFCSDEILVVIPPDIALWKGPFDELGRPMGAPGIRNE
jgi:hypothetical protein